MTTTPATLPANAHELVVTYSIKDNGPVILCACGWSGPRRERDDPHQIQLLTDDGDWHREVVTVQPNDGTGGTE